MEFTEERRKEVDHVDALVCEIFGINREGLYMKRGNESICNAKRIAWFILHYDYGHSFSIISSNYGRSMRAVKRGVSKIKNGIRNQPYYRDMYNSVHERIKEIP